MLFFHFSLHKISVKSRDRSEAALATIYSILDKNFFREYFVMTLDFIIDISTIFQIRYILTRQGVT